MTNAELVKLGHRLGTFAVLGVMLSTRQYWAWKANRNTRSELEKSHKRELYLASIIDREDVEVTEFDLIALQELSR